MRQAPPEPFSDFARAVMRREAARAAGAGDARTGFGRVCDALSARLTPLISAQGFETLFTRAITLASRDFPLLATVTVTVREDCAMSGIPVARDTAEAERLADALTAVVAHFIWLLVGFIGDDLGLRKVREIWPDVPFGSAHSSGVGE